MSLSDCPDCWDTPCRCTRGHLGSKNFEFEELQTKYAKLEDTFKMLETYLQNGPMTLEDFKQLTKDRL
jgi:hypothetical protein